MLVLIAMVYCNILIQTSVVQKRGSKLNRSSKVPNIIWSYWDDPDTVPDVVKLAHLSWRRYNPGYTIRLLDKHSIFKYFSRSDLPLCFNRLIHEHQADIIRIILLDIYGGYWIDSSMIFFRPLSTIFPVQHNVEFGGYYIKSKTTLPKYPVIENWFIMCSPNSRFIRRWRNELLSTVVNRFMYAMRRLLFGVDYQNIGSPAYLVMHGCAQVIMQRYGFRDFYLCDAEATAFLPHVINSWDGTRLGAYLVSTESYSLDTPCIKLRGCDRKHVDLTNVDSASKLGTLIHATSKCF